MNINALFLILMMLTFYSCSSNNLGEISQRKLSVLREIKQEDVQKMKKLQKMSSIYKLRGKNSRIALKNFSEEVLSYLNFLIEKAPLVRADLAWFETNKVPFNVRLSMYLTGGKTIAEREKNERKGLWDVRMYKKRQKNIESRISKKEPLSPNEIKNIQYPLN